MKNNIKDYFHRLPTYSNFRLILEMLFISLIAKLIFVFLGAVIFAIFGLPAETDLDLEKELASQGWIIATIFIILFAAFETLTSQSLVLWLTSRFSKNNLIRVLISAVVFALLHIDPLLVITVFPIGIVLATVFLIRREKSWWEAFWVTTTIHVLHNLLMLIFITSFPIP